MDQDDKKILRQGRDKSARIARQIDKIFDQWGEELDADRRKKEPFNSLASKLETALKDAKREPGAPSPEQQKRNQLLDRMKTALREGREQRRSDRQDVGQRIDDEVVSSVTAGHCDDDALSKAVQLAGTRNMLHEIRAENRYGEEKGILAVKDKEPHEKRPSVRALKQHRIGGRGR